jgi:two-component system OmpR family response regulator
MRRIPPRRPEEHLKADLRCPVMSHNGVVQILLAEDDPRMRAVVRRGLSEEGHVVEVAETGAAALDLAAAVDFDVLVLDVMLPPPDGVEVVRRLRASGRQTPALMLTARDAAADIVSALDAGADDYLTKPFSFQVLLARIRALGRRGPAARDVQLRVGDLELESATRAVTRGGEPVSLTRTEFNLLECLLRQAGRVVTRQMLRDRVWGDGRDVEDNTLDAFIKTLRQKVHRDGRPPVIQTIRGVGYSAREEPEP